MNSFATHNPSDRPLSAIILAAGKGTRMKSDLPKVVHPIGGRPMVCAVVDACLAAGVSRIVVVVGYQQEKVREALASYGLGSRVGVDYVVQAEQLGTGHAVQCAASALAKESATEGHEVLVLCGDGPLIRPATIRTMIGRHRSGSKANAGPTAATLATAVIEDPQGYGRIARDASGRFLAIVEQKNCTPDQLKLKEVNPSYYLFDARRLFEALRDVKRNPLSGEYYLTDTLELLLKAGRRVEVIEAVPPEDVLSINTLEDLARVDSLFRFRSPIRHPAGAHTQ